MGILMGMHKFFLTTILAAMLLPFASPSYALPAMDVQAEDLLRQTNDIKTSLNMSTNQQMLWQQMQSKANTILQNRVTRRDRVQTDLQLGLSDPKAELRDLAKTVDAEEDLSNQENKQLRELWLTVNDALDDNQRKIILGILMDQLQRSFHEKSESGKQKGDGHMRGTGRQKAGGMNSATNSGIPQ